MNILIKLLIAHLLSEFILQPKKWVADKEVKKTKSLYLYLHVVLTGAIAWLVLFELAFWWVAIIILVSHYFIDLWKLQYDYHNVLTFSLDQIGHITVIVFCAFLASDSTTYSFQDLIAEHATTKNLLIILGYLTVTTPAGYFVGLATQRWRNEITANGSARDSLEKAGIWIGILERVLVLTFVLLSQYEAIGFLIAAKSILRFSDRKEEEPRKQTEYVLIGTLISFSIALFTGLIVTKLV